MSNFVLLIKQGQNPRAKLLKKIPDSCWATSVVFEPATWKRLLLHKSTFHTAVKRGARAQCAVPAKTSLDKILNFRKFSLSSPKLRQSLKS